MRYKKLLLAMALSGFASQSNATYPSLESMLDNFAPAAPVQAPELNQLIIRLNALAPYPNLQQDALLSLVPLADGSLRAASDGPMRQVMSVIGERLLLVDMNEETGYAAGDEPTAHDAIKLADTFNPTEEAAKAVEAAKVVETTKAVTTSKPVEASKTSDATKPVDAIKTGAGEPSPKAELTKKLDPSAHKPEKSDKPKEEAATTDDKSEKSEKTDKDEKSTKSDTSKTDADIPSDIGKDDTKSSSTTSDSFSSSSSASKDKIPDLFCAKKIHGVWGQLLGDHISQDIRDFTPGYRADVLGGVIGRDLFIAPLMTVGVAGGYQHARVTQNDVSGSYMNINRYQLTGYGRYHLCEWPIYFLGAVTLAANRYENSRYILVPPTNALTQYSIIANSEFTGWESDIYLESGYVWKCGNFRAVPKIMLTFSHLDVDAYDESDAYALDLTVKYQDMNEFSLGLGGKIDYRNRFEKAYVVPELHAYYFYDFMNDAQISTAEFFSGGYAFLSQGPQPSPNTVELGAALAVHSYKNTVVKLQYDYTARTDYHRHGAFIKVRYEWA